MVFRTDDLIQSAVIAPSNRLERQTKQNTLNDTWVALVNYIRSTYRSGTGIVISELGAFIYQNSMKGGKSVRTPVFVFSPKFLTTTGLTCSPQQAPEMGDSALGSLFASHGPLFRLNWAGVGALAGLPASECRTAFAAIWGELSRFIRKRREGVVDFGVGVLRVDSTRCRLVFKPGFLSEIKGSGVLDRTATAQAMTGASTFRPTESMRGVTILKQWQ